MGTDSDKLYKTSGFAGKPTGRSPQPSCRAGSCSFDAASSVTPEKICLKMYRIKDAIRGFLQSCHNGTTLASLKTKPWRVSLPIPRINVLKWTFPGGTNTSGYPVPLPPCAACCLWVNGPNLIFIVGFDILWLSERWQGKALCWAIEMQLVYLLSGPWPGGTGH